MCPYFGHTNNSMHACSYFEVLRRERMRSLMRVCMCVLTLDIVIRAGMCVRILDILVRARMCVLLLTACSCIFFGGRCLALILPTFLPIPLIRQSMHPGLQVTTSSTVTATESAVMRLTSSTTFVMSKLTMSLSSVFMTSTSVMSVDGASATSAATQVGSITSSSVITGRFAIIRSPDPTQQLCVHRGGGVALIPPPACNLTPTSGLGGGQRRSVSHTL